MNMTTQLNIKTPFIDTELLENTTYLNTIYSRSKKLEKIINKINENTNSL